MQTNSTKTHGPYRTAVEIKRCGICAGYKSRNTSQDDRAVARCLRCGATLCLAHMPADAKTRCTRCEEAYAGRRRSIVNATSYVALILSGAGAFAIYGLTGTPSTTVGLAFGLWIVIAALGALIVRITRLAFLAPGCDGDVMLDDAEIEIAPAGLGRPTSKDVAPLRRRLEPPCAPIWQRTFGR